MPGAEGSVAGLTGVSGAIIALGRCGLGALRAAAFLRGADFRAVFFFAAFFFGADFRPAFRATFFPATFFRETFLRETFLRETFLRAVFLRVTLALDFTRAFLDFAAFLPARFFVAFFAAMFHPLLDRCACKRESRIAGIQNSPVTFGKPDSRPQR